MESIYAKKDSGWVNHYAGIHYGSHYLQKRWSKFLPVENFEYVERLSKLLMESFDDSCTNKGALDLGCCVGGVTFNLAAKFDEIIGLDINKGFLEVCEKLKQNGKATMYSCEEGDLEKEMLAVIPDSIDRSRCSFILGDVHALPSEIGTFGCVVVSNLLHCIKNPIKVLKTIPGLLDDNGICVIASPHYSSEEFTPKANWVGGYSNKDGQAVKASTTIKEILSDQMEFIQTVDIPFAMQYRYRDFELNISEVQIWKKSSKIVQTN